MFGNSIPTPPPMSVNPNIVHKPKPIFVMRFRNSLSDSEFNIVKDTIYKSDMNNEYHIIALRNDKDKDEFEMYNSDKIERQNWNTLVNKITK
jgi:hypothetical protein